jgi:hypothetical protein
VIDDGDETIKVVEVLDGFLQFIAVFARTVARSHL